MAEDKLAQLVVTGKKTATSSSLISYTYEEERMPVVNQYDVVLDGFDQPVAIIQYTKIEIMPIKEVSNLFASLEGEGDLSLSYWWYNVHKKIFTAELEAWGKQFSDELLIVCQTFKVVG
ncbi:ASCH domain-containing protein [Pediococcus pentosaceus]|uniref:ASCH domain-containing protein n=1 Tax=Pediococcus pentosaceus TaxID=1255 RepID=UPI002FBE901A